MKENDALHITRNPWGYSVEEQRAAALFLADGVDKWRAAYENMREFAISRGLDTACTNESREGSGHE